MPTHGEITQLLNRADQGDHAAADELFRMIEGELKAIAAKRKQKFAAQFGDSTTGLVDNVFCELVGQNITNWESGDRRKFFTYAANKIHDLLVDAARANAAKKRGGDAHQISIDQEGLGGLDRDTASDLTLLADLKSALSKLDQVAPEEGKAFRIRYFLGCTFDELAEILATSPTRAKTLFRKAQIMLQLELKDYQDDS